MIWLTEPDGSSLDIMPSSVDWKAADCPATEGMTYWLKTLALRSVSIVVIGAKLPIKAMMLKHNNPTDGSEIRISGSFNSSDGSFHFVADSNFNLASPMEVEITAVNGENITDIIDV